MFNNKHMEVLNPGFNGSDVFFLGKMDTQKGCEIACLRDDLCQSYTWTNTRASQWGNLCYARHDIGFFVAQRVGYFSGELQLITKMPTALPTASPTSAPTNRSQYPGYLQILEQPSIRQQIKKIEKKVALGGLASSQQQAIREKNAKLLDILEVSACILLMLMEHSLFYKLHRSRR
jgi:hypothetical protein